ncbi:MAG TPA: 6-bladed beta-propeller [Niabella sp.]|nr:6-bladed beta-propeller [Niabella sp.]HOZ95994.1 6-bladed beta-propeller [Niabella sp.]HQW15511.1 6-bladed beta-propeller [Niabella sp.]HQX20653.1 6-bladed beta-propeller [Niabella sp.]HQX40529.1 6-bladed beta-propeller [Niabella sp.]
MKYLLSFILLLSQHLQAQDTTTLRIDVAQAKPMNVSEVFDSIHYIKLKFPEGCKHQNILGRISVTKNYFLTFDGGVEKAIFIFDKKGNFINKIDHLPKKTMDEKDIFSLAAYVIDFDSDLIYFGYKDTENKKRRFYISCIDVYGKEMYKKTVFENPPLDQYFIQKLDEETFLLNSSFDAKELTDLPTHPVFQILNLKNGITKSFLNISGDSSYKFYNRYISVAGHKETYWSKSYNYQAVKFNGKGNPSVLKFIFPAQVCMPHVLPLTDDLIKNYQTADDFAQKNKTIISEINSIFSLRQWVLFRVEGYSSKGHSTNFMYSQKTGAIVDLKQVKPDKLSKGVPFMSYGIIGVDDQYVYTSMPSIVLNQNATPQSNFVSPNATSVTIGAPSNDNGVYLLQLKIKSAF